MTNERNNSIKNNAQEPDIVFSKVVTAGKRIYYLDVKKSRKGELFVTITESKKIFSDNLSQPPHYEKHKIFLYKEDFDKFITAMNEILAYAKENNTVDFVPNKEVKKIDKIEKFNLKID